MMDEYRDSKLRGVPASPRRLRVRRLDAAGSHPGLKVLVGLDRGEYGGHSSVCKKLYDKNKSLGFSTVQSVAASGTP